MKTKSQKLKEFYYLWIVMNIVRFILLDSPFKYKPEFFNPFTLIYNYFFIPAADYYKYFDTYDYTELIVYILAPLVIWYLAKFLPRKSVES